MIFDYMTAVRLSKEGMLSKDNLVKYFWINGYEGHPDG